MLACRPMRAGDHQLAVAISLAWLLVLARSLVYLAYPHAAFDSDQAVVGLMAKHLSEGRAFPLYLYGYGYMLAVESWLAVPYFWIAGPTAAALRASIVGTNLAVVTLLIVGLCRWGGLRPWTALAAVVFFAFVPPDTAANLVEAGGGSIEQFLWILVLWFVRTRPLVFGAVLAVGFLNREFTIYAVPVILAGQVWTRAILRIETWRSWLLALVAFVGVWQGVQSLTPLADLMGPGTRGQIPYGRTGSTLDNLTHRMRIDVVAAPSGIATLMNTTVRTLVGGRPAVQALADQGRNWIGWMLGLAALAAVLRIGWLAIRRRQPMEIAATGWYVLGVGVTAVVGYALTRPTEIVTPRYLLLSLFIPVGLTAVWLALEPRRVVRQSVAGIVIVWSLMSGIDNWRQYERYASSGATDPMVELVAELEARGVTIAEAEHWRAYKLTFLSQERVKVASTDVIRIREYRQLADEAGSALVHLEKTLCPGQRDARPVGGMYICGGNTPHPSPY